VSQLIRDTAAGVDDFIIHAGDIAYNVDDNCAEVGDEFMNAIQPIAANVPYMCVHTLLSLTHMPRWFRSMCHCLCVHAGVPVPVPVCVRQCPCVCACASARVCAPVPVSVTGPDKLSGCL
jgi:hypothetical protein